MSPIPDVSIVIIVHNGEKLLRRSAQSVLRQDYQNLELVLVENGSTDRTREICEEIQAEDKRVHLYTSAKGEIFARIKGIEESSGKWLLYVDHDDFYRNEHAVSDMLKEAETYQCDICQFSYFRKKGLFVQKSARRNSPAKIDRNQLLDRYIAGVMGGYRETISPVVWDKIFRTDILKSSLSRLPSQLGQIKVAADMTINLAALFDPLVRTVAFSENAYYVYNEMIGITGTDAFTDKLLDAYEVIKPWALRLAEAYHAGGYPITKCHRESLNMLDAAIVRLIVQGKSKQDVLEAYDRYASCAFIREASEYFLQDQSREWDTHILNRAAIGERKAYYARCLGEMGNVRLARMQYRGKQAIKQMIRFVQG